MDLLKETIYPQIKWNMALISKDAQKYLDSLDATAQAWVLANADAGSKLTSGEAKRAGKAYEAVQAEAQKEQDEFLKTVPAEIIENVPSFMELDYDTQQGVFGAYEIMIADADDKAEKMDKAFDLAVADSDPYMKQIMRIMQDETMRYFEEANGQYHISVERIQRRRDELKEDLSRNLADLDLDLQAELAQTEDVYIEQQRGVIQSAANSGVTFGEGELSRFGMERDLSIKNDDIVESTKRQYGNQVRDLTLQAQRGDVEAQETLDDYTRDYGSRIQEIGRSAEIYAGSDRVAEFGIEGYNPMGNVSGTFDEDVVVDRQQRKDAFFGELNQDSLNYSQLI